MFQKIIFSVAKVTAYLVIIPAMIALLMGAFKYANSFRTPRPQEITLAQLDTAIKGEKVSKIIPREDDEQEKPQSESEIKTEQANIVTARDVIINKLGAGFDSLRLVEYLTSQTADISSKNELLAYENLGDIINKDASFDDKSKLVTAFFPLFTQSISVANEQKLGKFEVYGQIGIICFSLLLISVFSLVLIGLDNRKAIEELKRKIGK